MKETTWERLFKCAHCGKMHRVKSRRRDLDVKQKALEMTCAVGKLKTNKGE